MVTNQDFTTSITVDDDKVTTLTTTIPDNFAILRNEFRGTAAPPSPIAGQLWEDTTLGAMKMWDGSAWQVLGPLHTYTPAGLTLSFTSLSATTNKLILIARTTFVVTMLGLVSDSATISDASNNWVWNLRDVTGSLDLFSTKPTTNGDELAINTAKIYTPNQNATLDPNDVLRFEATKTGTPGNLTDLLVQVDGYALKT